MLARFSLLLFILLPLLSEAAELRRRSTTSAAVQEAQARSSFNTLVLQTIQHDMPSGGGYSATPEDVARAAEAGVEWSEALQGLVISPQRAAPTFCSAACYMVLLRSLQRWEAAVGRRLPSDAWEALDIKGNQPDGTGAWGRANANGPGLAMLIHELSAGINFHDVRLARPGDFLKIFWNENIGAAERGHLVVFLGLERKNGAINLRYWSANKPGGYGARSVPLSRMHHLIFTRITAPQNFSRANRLREHHSWLHSMQTRAYTFGEVRRACNIR